MREVTMVYEVDSNHEDNNNDDDDNNHNDNYTCSIERNTYGGNQNISERGENAYKGQRVIDGSYMFKADYCIICVCSMENSGVISCAVA